MTSEDLPQDTLRAVLDELIPARDASLPGAGTLGVGEFVARHLGVATPLVAAGLQALETRARERGADGFADLPAQDRVALLEAVGEEHAGLIPSLVYHTYNGYYHHPEVSIALGLEGRPPHPVGYPLEQGDLGLLDAVRGRAGLWREV